jgi:hypothetical protein
MYDGYDAKSHKLWRLYSVKYNMNLLFPCLQSVAFNRGLPARCRCPRVQHRPYKSMPGNLLRSEVYGFILYEFIPSPEGAGWHGGNVLNSNSGGSLFDSRQKRRLSWGFSRFSSVDPGNFRCISHCVTTVYFQIILNSRIMLPIVAMYAELLAVSWNNPTENRFIVLTVKSNAIP